MWSSRVALHGLTPRSTQGILMLRGRVLIAPKHQIKIAQHKIDEISLNPPYLVGAVLARGQHRSPIGRLRLRHQCRHQILVKALNNGQ